MGNEKLGAAERKGEKTTSKLIIILRHCEKGSKALNTMTYEKQISKVEPGVDNEY